MLQNSPTVKNNRMFTGTCGIRDVVSRVFLACFILMMLTVQAAVPYLPTFLQVQFVILKARVVGSFFIWFTSCVDVVGMAKERRVELV